jgi:hypothetical protein
MICTSCMSREMQVYKIIIIYAFFIEFTDGIDDDGYTLHVELFF